MKTKLKVHPMEIPLEIIDGIFATAEKQNLRIELLEVIGITALRVDLIYKKDQRKKAMRLIEQVDNYLHDQEERIYQKEKKWRRNQSQQKKK